MTRAERDLAVAAALSAEMQARTKWENAQAAHTPGPWWVTDSGVRDRGGYICHTNAAQRYEGQDERFAQESAERAANKILIAAAPELLEALQMLLNGETEHLTAQGVRNVARAAIAKATGVTP